MIMRFLKQRANLVFLKYFEGCPTSLRSLDPHVGTSFPHTGLEKGSWETAQICYKLTFFEIGAGAFKGSTD